MSLKTATKLENNRVELEIEVDAATFEAAVNAAYKKDVKKMSVPGFRKGKAPRAMIEKMYGTGVFYETAMNDVYPTALDAAIKESGYEYVEDKIDLDVVSVGPEGLVFKAVITVKPEVKMRGHKSLKISRPAVVVTDEDIDAAILAILAESDAPEITKEIAEYYMETTLAADADPEAALREYLAVEMEEERMSYVHSEVSYQVGEALLGSVVYKKLPEEAVAFQMNSMREDLQNQYERLKEHEPEYAAMTFEEFIVDYFDVEDVENCIQYF